MLHRGFIVKEFFPAGAAADDIHGGEEAAVGQLAVQVQLHVAGALKLLVNHLIHPAAGIHQASADDGQAAAFFDVAGGPKELLGGIKGCRIDTAGKGAPAGRNRQVIGPGQPGNAVQQDNHVLAVFHQTLGAFQGQLGHPALFFHRLIEGGGEYIAADRPAHIGYFLRALAD